MADKKDIIEKGLDAVTDGFISGLDTLTDAFGSLIGASALVRGTRNKRINK
jgi:hypothetical protein